MFADTSNVETPVQLKIMHDSCNNTWRRASTTRRLNRKNLTITTICNLGVVEILQIPMGPYSLMQHYNS